MKTKHKIVHIKVNDSSAQNIFIAVNVKNESTAKQDKNKEKDTTRDFLRKLGEAALAAYSQKKTTKTKTGIILAFISSFAITIFTAITIKTNLLPASILTGIILVWAVVFCLLPIFINLKGWTRAAKIICGGGLVILLLIGVFLNAVDYTFQKMQIGENEKVIYSVIARSDNERLKGVGYIAGNDIAFLETENSSIAQDVLKNKISKYAGVDYFGDIDTEDSLYNMYENFVTDAKGSSIICLDQTQLQLASEKISDFDEKTKIIYTFEAEVPSYKNNGGINKNSAFVAYFSVANQYDFGDKVGDRNTEIKNYHSFNYMRGLSEINRLIAVNIKTRKMLIIDTPAEYYIQLNEENDTLDELANAGIYGIRQSIGVLEELYGVKIDYYFRSTYDNLEEIANAAGIETDFSDETKSRETIDAMINKMSDLRTFLPRYDAVLMRIDKGIQTDFPAEQLSELTKDMLANDAKWDVEYYTVSGEKFQRTLYSLGTDDIEDEVIIPDETSLATAKQKLKAILEN